MRLKTLKTSTKMLTFFSNEQLMRDLWVDGIARGYAGSISCRCKICFVTKKIVVNVKNGD